MSSTINMAKNISNDIDKSKKNNNLISKLNSYEMIHTKMNSPSLTRVKKIIYSTIIDLEYLNREKSNGMKDFGLNSFSG